MYVRERARENFFAKKILVTICSFQNYMEIHCTFVNGFLNHGYKQCQRVSSCFCLDLPHPYCPFQPKQDVVHGLGATGATIWEIGGRAWM